MWKRLVPFLLFVGIMMGTGVGITSFHPSDLAADSLYTLVASGLDNPRGLDFGPHGALYVAEAGVGGGGACIPGPTGTPICYGATGAVTRIHKGEQKRVITGLPSLAGDGGFFSFGPQDVSIKGGHANIAIGLDATVQDRDSMGDSGDQFAHLVQAKYKAKRQVRLSDLADLGAYEMDNNSDGAQSSDGQPELRSNPNSVLAYRKGLVAVDSGANALLSVRRKDRVSTMATFPTREVEFPPDSGNMMSMQSVPTSVAMGPDGAFYVGELTGFPFPEGAARIYRVVPGQDPEVYLDGFTHVIDLAIAEDGTMFVLQIADISLLSVFSPGGQLATGSVIKVSPSGEREVLVNSEGLIMPTGLAIGPDGSVYVSNCGVCAGNGEVVRISIGSDHDHDHDHDDHNDDDDRDSHE